MTVITGKLMSNNNNHIGPYGCYEIAAYLVQN